MIFVFYVDNTELVQLIHSNDQDEFVIPVLGEEEEEEEERAIKTTNKNKKRLLPPEPSSCHKSQTVQTPAIKEVGLYTDPLLNDSQMGMSKAAEPYIKPVRSVKRTSSAARTKLPKHPPKIKDSTQSQLPVVPKPKPVPTQPPKTPSPAPLSVLPPPIASKIKFPPPPPTSAPPPSLAPPPPPPDSSPQEDDVYDSNSFDEEQGIYDDVTAAIIDDDLNQENYEEVDSKVNIGMHTFTSSKNDKQISDEYEALELSHVPASLKSEEMYF